MAAASCRDCRGDTDNERLTHGNNGPTKICTARSVNRVGATQLARFAGSARCGTNASPEHGKLSLGTGRFVNQKSVEVVFCERAT